MQTQRQRQAKFEEAWVSWLPGIEWDLFCHATFPWRPSAEDAERMFHRFLDKLEREMRGRIACVSVRENESRDSNEYVGEHFHFVLRGEKQIPVDMVKKLWCDIVRDTREGKDSMSAERFEEGRGGREYIFKMCAQLNAALPYTKNLKFFDPDVELMPYGKHQQRLHMKRFLKRQLAIRQDVPVVAATIASSTVVATAHALKMRSEATASKNVPGLHPLEPKGAEFDGRI